MFTTLFVLFTVAAGLVEASHDVRSPRNAHHPRALHNRGSNASSKPQRCRPRTTSLVSSSTKAAPTTTTQAKPTTTTHKTTTTTTKAAVKTTAAPSNDDGGSTSGVIKVTSSQCGGSGASTTPSKTNGPNGRLSWLNCGLDAGGWNPPFVKASDLITKELYSAVAQSGSPFKACSSYIDLFVKYGNMYGLPPILLASISLQESTCNPNAMAGDMAGLMQITPDKCGGAPGGNCRDPEYNVRTGAKYFADTLAQNGGNIVLTMGTYNGWYKGLTVGAATAAAHSGCCICQQNLDYLHQIFNGWLQNIDANAAGMGQYFNLNVC